MIIISSYSYFLLLNKSLFYLEILNYKNLNIYIYIYIAPNDSLFCIFCIIFFNYDNFGKVTGLWKYDSDGFWDVISVKKAIQLVLQVLSFYMIWSFFRYYHPSHLNISINFLSWQTKERSTDESSAEKIANFLLSEARTLRTKDNTSIIFLDFHTTRISCKVGSWFESKGFSVSVMIIFVFFWFLKLYHPFSLLPSNIHPNL